MHDVSRCFYNVRPPHTRQKKVLPALEKGDYRVVEGGGRLRYGCARCGAVVNSRHSVRAHIAARHLRREPFRCPLCRQAFKHRGTIAQHLAKKHGMVEVRVDGGTTLKPAENRACDVCRKEFPSKTLLRKHMVTHRRPKCPECGDEFRKDELSIHRSKEHGVAIPTCGVCGYQNSMEYRIIAHQRKVHLMEKNLQCPQCEMKFFDKMDLTKHLVRHNPVRNHACSYCHKKFPRASALRLHERIHTGDKRQVCGICGERFVQKASLNYHLAKRHPETTQATQDTAPSPSSSQTKDVST